MKHLKACATKSTAAVICFLLSPAAPPALAEEVRPAAVSVRLAIGSRTRITPSGASTTPLVGTVRAVDESSITIETSGGATIRMPRREIRSLQVSLDQKRNTVKGALIGAGIAAGLGAVLGAAGCGPSTATNSYLYADCTRTEGALLLGAFLAPGGAFWGGLIGHRVRSDQWTDLPPTPDALAAPRAAAEERPVQGPPPPPAATRLQAPAPLAQANSRLFAGARVRVSHDGQKTEGLLMAISPVAVTIAASAGTLSIPRDAVAGIESWGGEQKRPLRGALIGLVAGAALDFTSEPYCSTLGASRDCSRLSSASETALGGAIIGAGIGLLVKKTTWIPVRLADAEAEPPSAPSSDLAWQISPVLAGRGHGAGLRLRLAW